VVRGRPSTHAAAAAAAAARTVAEQAGAVVLVLVFGVHPVVLVARPGAVLAIMVPIKAHVRMLPVLVRLAVVRFVRVMPVVVVAAVVVRWLAGVQLALVVAAVAVVVVATARHPVAAAVEVRPSRALVVQLRWSVWQQRRLAPRRPVPVAAPRGRVATEPFPLRVARHADFSVLSVRNLAFFPECSRGGASGPAHWRRVRGRIRELALFVLVV